MAMPGRHCVDESADHFSGKRLRVMCLVFDDRNQRLNESGKHRIRDAYPGIELEVTTCQRIEIPAVDGARRIARIRHFSHRKWTSFRVYPKLEWCEAHRNPIGIAARLETKIVSGEIHRQVVAVDHYLIHLPATAKACFEAEPLPPKGLGGREQPGPARFRTWQRGDFSRGGRRSVPRKAGDERVFHVAAEISVQSSNLQSWAMVASVHCPLGRGGIPPAGSIILIPIGI